MQHLTSVLWSLDNKYVLSASDEMNIRIWKANASEKLGTVSYFFLWITMTLANSLIVVNVYDIFNLLCNMHNLIIVSLC